MQPEVKYPTDGLPPEWIGVAVEMLTSRRIGVDLYRARTVKERLMEGMAWPNITALIKFARQDSRSRGHIGDRLCLDPRTLERWAKKAVQPHPRSFFGLLYVGLRREIADDLITYPTSRAVIAEAVCSTLQIICKKDIGHPVRRPELDGLVLIRRFMRHRLAGRVARAISGGDGSTVKDEITSILVSLIPKPAGQKSDRFPEPAKAKAALATINDLAVAYALFRFGLPDEMGFLLEGFDEEPA